MTNNDILRRLRYTFDFKDAKMVEIFAAADHKVTEAQILNWLKQEEEKGYKEMKDKDFAYFLDGFINDKRGKKEGPSRPPEENLNNNIVFRKLKIALNLQAEEILEILALVKMRISKHELSAFFRNPKQSQYRPCKDQMLRNFLQGLQEKHRPKSV